MTTFLSTLRALDAAATPGPWQGVPMRCESTYLEWPDGTRKPFQMPIPSGPDMDLTAFLRNRTAAIAGVVEAAEGLLDAQMMVQYYGSYESAAIIRLKSASVAMSRALAALEAP